MTYSLEIRHYQRTDRHQLWRLLVDATEHWATSARRLDEQLEAIRDRGGQAWLLFRNEMLAGCALVDPIPGLVGMGELQGCITPSFRRQGLATYLLTHLIADMSDLDLGLITHPLDKLESPAGRFLQKQGWFIEHEEIKMRYGASGAIPKAELPPNYEIKTLPLPIAVNTFRSLYERSFVGSAWFQPYLNDEEVVKELESAEDILFLAHNGSPVGFAWIRWPTLLEVEIEPVGLAPEFQHRGLGQPFLKQVMRQVKEQGASTIRIGAWNNNDTAISLYRKIGFQLESTTTYLAFQIRGNPDNS